MNNNEFEFTRIVRENKGTIFTVCYMFSKDEDEVNDMFQEVLVNLWKGFEGFKGESKVETWIYRVALNTCISMERSKKRRGKRMPLSMEANLYIDRDTKSMQIRQLHKRIQRLGVIDRAIVLMWLEDMSYEEIADVIGITAQNVGVKLHRIKEELRSDNKE
ncbi:MAG: sigma-70 family RNA polymerase sigma factor [Paludibacteraceae bacterium]|nr:sigma-70 family RNA polymerase sigma factor [Paludibacteraceae bacterium]